MFFLQNLEHLDRILTRTICLCFCGFGSEPFSAAESFGSVGSPEQTGRTRTSRTASNQNILPGNDTNGYHGNITGFWWSPVHLRMNKVLLLIWNISKVPECIFQHGAFSCCGTFQCCCTADLFLLKGRRRAEPATKHWSTSCPAAFPTLVKGYDIIRQTKT